MRPSTGAKEFQPHQAGWVLLAEYALGEMMPANAKEDGLTAGFLIQPFQEWGVPPELINKIELNLREFAQKPGFPVQPGRQERAGIFRVFCQNKVIGDAKAAETARLDQAEPTLEASLEASPIQDPSCTISNQGWGYFIIDRSGGDAGSSERCSLQVDLYLYQEGE